MRYLPSIKREHFISTIIYLIFTFILFGLLAYGSFILYTKGFIHIESLKETRDNETYLFILYASIIAGFSVLFSTFFNYVLKLNETRDSYEQTYNTLNITVSYLKQLIKKNQGFTWDIIGELPISNDENLTKNAFSTVILSNEYNKSALLGPIEKLIDNDISKHLKKEEIEILIDIKLDILNIISKVQIIKEIHLPSNSRKQLITTAQQISSIMLQLDDKVVKLEEFQKGIFFKVTNKLKKNK